MFYSNAVNLPCDKGNETQQMAKKKTNIIMNIFLKCEKDRN